MTYFLLAACKIVVLVLAHLILNVEFASLLQHLVGFMAACFTVKSGCFLYKNVIHGYKTKIMNVKGL